LNLGRYSSSYLKKKKFLHWGGFCVFVWVISELSVCLMVVAGPCSLDVLQKTKGIISLIEVTWKFVSNVTTQNVVQSEMLNRLDFSLKFLPIQYRIKMNKPKS
jgi:LEA14-like dessication related protein